MSISTKPKLIDHLLRCHGRDDAEFMAAMPFGVLHDQHERIHMQFTKHKIDHGHVARSGR